MNQKRKIKKKYFSLKDYVLRAYDTMLVPPPSVRLQFWPKLDSAIGGLREYEYTILCGVTGGGKTAWVASLAEKIASQGHGVYVASIETGPEDFTRRVISARAGKNYNTGDVVPAREIQDFRRNNPDVENGLPIHIATYEDRVDNREIMEQVSLAILNNGVKVAIIDNLNFCLEVRRQNEQIIEMDRVVHDWIIYSKQNPVHIIMIMHPRKTEDGRIEHEFDIKGSSTAVQEAHNILLFNRLPSKLVRQNHGYFSRFRDIKIAKCRRRGFAVGGSISFVSRDGVSYEEEEFDTSNESKDGSFKKHASFAGRRHDSQDEIGF